MFGLNCMPGILAAKIFIKAYKPRRRMPVLRAIATFWKHTCISAVDCFAASLLKLSGNALMDEQCDQDNDGYRNAEQI